MDTACMDHCLTADERLAFDTKGYLILPNVLSPQVVSGLSQAADRVDAEAREEHAIDSYTRQTVRDILWRDDQFLELVDWPLTFPKVWGLLGWNIQIYHSVLAYSPPEKPENRTVTFRGWHQDSDRLNYEIECSPRPRISVKVAFFLSDCSKPGSANFWAVPGSHLKDQYDIPQDGTLPVDAEAILVSQGSAVIFDRRLWHTASSNAANISRKALFYGYSYRWLRPRDDQTVDHLFNRCDPIRRQLLGYSPTGGYGYTSPTDADVPLRGWLRTFLGEDAVAT